MSTVEVQAAPPVPRKKRKRAPTAGAAADCFACSDRGVSCDRKRPYCSQCLDEGKDCSGYKTQLTWGIGVASRGKLRGLSVPIAGTGKVADALEPPTKQRKKSAPVKRNSKADLWSGGVPDTPSLSLPTPETLISPSMPIKEEPLPYPTTTFHSFQPLSISPVTTTTPVDVLQTPSTYSASPQDTAYTLFHDLLSGGNFWSNNSTHDMASSVRYDDYRSDPACLDPQSIVRDIKGKDRSGEDECANSDALTPYAGNIPCGQIMIPSPFTGLNTSVGKTPRMQYLINYYVEVISPVIVAFDHPSNPYRTQILRLAAESETLQHAISALSASNIRQRKETPLSTCKTDPARRSSFAHMALTDRAELSAQDQIREETYHKRYAIQSLNNQLANPLQRKEDSILATLLILCLFHICDSGVAKFKTQFAGVKKLLHLRNDFALNSGTKWFTRMFTWFDAITATVNDREGQLQGSFIDICSMSDEDDMALETLAGCDSHLFRTIAQLGRLNALRLGKDESKSTTSFSRIQDYSTLDGNGWRVMNDFVTTAKPSNTTLSDNDCDMQNQFWHEWRAIRTSLQTWYSTDAPGLNPDQRLDLANISESFRYSALLYTERLASAPNTPSSSPSLQAWVKQSLQFIKQVKSDVYLLWPLFITGSECVDELDRVVIRERCLDIQKDSGFFNNQSCLELLEKVWAGGEMRVHDSSGADGKDIESGFRFSHVMRMEGGDGEYIVV